MKRIAFIVGPQLGHVVRIHETAMALADLGEFKITFVTPGTGRFLEELCKDRFELIKFDIEGGEYIELCEAFSGALAGLFARRRFDLIVHDMCPMRWLATTRFPACPRVNITNVFLTGVAAADTVQARHFAREGTKLNEIRISKNLPPLSSPFEVYESDLVLLADPFALTGRYGSLPPRYQPCGPITSRQKGDIPDKLRGIADALLVSMGSTGSEAIGSELISAVRTASGGTTVIYAGDKAEEFRAAGSVDYAYAWLPLEQMMPLAIAVISQGGTGSTYQALMHGVPSFIYPTHRNQLLLARILEDMGVAVCIAGDDAQERIRRTDFAALRENAGLVAASEPAESGARNAASAILEII